MSQYEQLLRDRGFVRAVINAVSNNSEAFPREDFLKRFEKNVEARNAHVDAVLKQRAEQA